MLQGRTFSYSDTQRYRVGTNYLQLPINAPKKHVATNQRDGQMAYHVDAVPGQNRHVNYEPSNLNGLTEAPPTGVEHTPHYEARLVRQPISRTNDFEQPGDRYRQHTEEEKDDLIANLVDALTGAAPIVQEKMVGLFAQCDTDWGRRVAQGLTAVAGSPAIAGNGLQNEGADAAVKAEAIDAKAY
jgi:catalase